MKKAIEKFPTFEEKFITRPFAVDQEVWNKETNKKGDYVLFVEMMDFVIMNLLKIISINA